MRVGSVKVAWAHGTPPVAAASLDVALSDADRERAAGFGAARLGEFVAGRALVRGLVRELFPQAERWQVLSRSCIRCGARHGPVEVSGVPVVASISYAAGLVVAAVAPTSRLERLGVDVELDAVDATREQDLRRLLGASTEPMLRRWTRIEAVLKADGRGLLVDPGVVRLQRGNGHISGERIRYQLADVAGPPGYLISLAWCGSESSAAGARRATP